MNKYLTGTPNYDKTPSVTISDNEEDVTKGWPAIISRVIGSASLSGVYPPVIAIECYQGIEDNFVLPYFRSYPNSVLLMASDCYKSESDIKQMVYPDVTDDEVFGYITRLTIADYLEPSKVRSIKEKIEAVEEKVDAIFIYGPGASLVAEKNNLIVYLDLARWEIQKRFRADKIGNLGIGNPSQKTSLQYKHAFFVDWRVCDKHKAALFNSLDYIIDANDVAEPKMLSYEVFRNAISQAAARPIRLVPFFDPGPWGGRWIMEYCDLDRRELNYAWCFDCVPEENSLLFKFGKTFFETPAINLVFLESKNLLGDAVEARFGKEFPIRFDFLDTMEGGNLSLQVHPTTDYIRREFGMQYTQDESYYILDAGPNAAVYLGTKNNVKGAELIGALKAFQAGGPRPDVEKFVNKFPVKKHDHILIPAGTIHCSGADSMVLEISATPYIFTFKLYDWGRLGLDGKPRPINIDRGNAVIDWTRDTDMVKSELINNFQPFRSLHSSEEIIRTGLHESQFIETHVQDFTDIVSHHTCGSVNVLNLVDGREAIVESPTGSFSPFVVHYAETFIVPSQIGTYTIRPFGESEGMSCKIIKAFVRIHA